MVGISSPGVAIEGGLIGGLIGGNKVEEKTQNKWRKQVQHKWKLIGKRRGVLKDRWGVGGCGREETG